MAVDCCAVLWFVAAANKMTSCGGESASGHKAGGCGGKRSCVEFCGQTAHAQHHTLRVDACNTSVQNTKHTCTCGTMLDSRTGVFCVGVGMIYVHSRLLGACGCCLAGSARIAVSPAVGVTSTLSILFYLHAETWQYRPRLEVRRQQRRKKRAVDTAAATAAATATIPIPCVCAHRSRWSMTSCSLSLQPHNILRATHLRQAPTSVVRRQWCRLIVAWPTSKSSCYPSCRQERSMRGGRVSRVQQPVGAGRP